MKKQLEIAVQKKDPEKIERVLEEIASKIPESKLSKEDKEIHKDARKLIQELEPEESMFNGNAIQVNDNIYIFSRL